MHRAHVVAMEVVNLMGLAFVVPGGLVPIVNFVNLDTQAPIEVGIVNIKQIMISSHLLMESSVQLRINNYESISDETPHLIIAQ